LLGIGALVVYKLLKRPGIKVITLEEFKALHSYTEPVIVEKV